MSLRAVLDTNVLVAAIRSDRGASRALLNYALDRRYRMLVSVPLMLEYEAVLTREEQLDASGLSRDDVQVLLDAVAAVSEPVRLAYLWRPLLPDPQDDMLLETAANGHADVLVTLNRRHFEPAIAGFAIDVALPADALEQVRRWK